MDFKNVAKSARPVYTWFWNATITREGIKKQIDEMYESGIRGFYVLGEPEYFRPLTRKTFLKPEYLSEEYLDLLYYAYELAEEKGMEFWLYNEGGFPSGMVCGKIRQLRPHLAKKHIGYREYALPTGEKYIAGDDSIAAFVNGERILNGFINENASGVVVGEYVMIDEGDRPLVNSDIAQRETTDLFLEMTHEVLKKRFGDKMGKEITFMFDDEAHMGLWTRGLDRIFYERYGYEIYPYLPYVARRKPLVNDDEYRAVSDYGMLCGELTVNNYFIPMKKWLNDHNMLSIGHLDCESVTQNVRFTLYGNMMNAYRAFDVPGIDVIWSQITYPDEKGNSCFEGNDFFPRLASSAARQCGHSMCLSETFAVHGAQICPEEMRFDVNYQAVRGISIFNFMTVSYERQRAMCLQYRPNFIKESPGMDNLTEINEYTARVCHILQSSRADIRSAIYLPSRTIIAGGEKGIAAAHAYDCLGRELERCGVCFDVIDEALALEYRLEDGRLVGEHVTYENVFVPDGCFLELPEVMERLGAVGKEICPCIERESRFIQARKLVFDDGDEGYFICSSANETLSEVIGVESDKTPYIVDLGSGEMYFAEYTREGDKIKLPVTLLRGDGFLLYLSDKEQAARPVPKYETVEDITDLVSYVNRRYVIDPVSGPMNLYPERVDRAEPLAPWDDDFSGEVTYVAKIKSDCEDAAVDLGAVNHWSRIYVNERLMAEATMPPYRAHIGDVKAGDELKVVVANTISQACTHTDYFEVQDKTEIGSYHPKMKVWEAKAPAGGLFGPVRLLKKI